MRKVLASSRTSKSWKSAIRAPAVGQARRRGAALLAQITRKSLAALELRPGLPVYAVVKSVALLL